MKEKRARNILEEKSSQKNNKSTRDIRGRTLQALHNSCPRIAYKKEKTSALLTILSYLVESLLFSPGGLHTGLTSWTSGRY